MNTNLEAAVFDAEGEGEPPYLPELYSPGAEAYQVPDLD
jgi:hypothetical protein